jgi:hypothetical protein
MNKIVYDCLEVNSPYYNHGEYLNNEEIISVPVLKDSYNKNQINRYYESLQPYYKLQDS